MNEIRRASAASTLFQTTINTNKAVTPLHGHNYTQHIPNTAEACAKPLINAVYKHDWNLKKSPRHIAAHIDHVKFGREDYGYGLGSAELTTKNPNDQISTRWGSNFR